MYNRIIAKKRQTFPSEYFFEYQLSHIKTSLNWIPRLIILLFKYIENINLSKIYILYAI